MSVRVQFDRIDLVAELAALTAGPDGRPRHDIGAAVTFTGLVRDDGLERDVGLRRDVGSLALTALTLEHYPGMTERALEDIERQAGERWPLTATRIVHRVGRMTPGEVIVFVGAASAHRQPAFDAAAYLMDYLKTRAPFWKHEETADGKSHWVGARLSDTAAAERWSTESVAAQGSKKPSTDN